MTYQTLPNGDVVIKGNWIARQNQAIASRKDREEMFTLDAVRGAHIHVERLKNRLLAAPAEEHVELKGHLKAAEDRLAKACAAHAAYEKGDVVEAEAPAPSPEQPSDADPADPATPPKPGAKPKK